jgi:hypothetical protein
MTVVLTLLLALQSGDPKIEKVERLLGDVNRPLLWTPLKVTLTSASDFSGDLVARSRFGFSVARAVTLRAGNHETILLPALDPEEVVVGKATAKVPKDFVRPDRIVLVDARLPYAGDLVSTAQVLYQKISAEDLEKTLPRGLLEAADLVLVKEGPGSVAATREEAERAIAALKEHAPSLEAVDGPLWVHAPPSGWVPAKRTWTLFFATMYAFAAFVALAVVAKRFPKFGLACAGAVALLGIVGYWQFPRGQAWVVGQAVTVLPPAGAAQEQRTWFVHSAALIPAASFDFPRLVKPIFPTMAGTDDPFTLRVNDRGCSVEGLKLLPGRPACFGGGEGVAASEPSGPAALTVLVKGGEAEGLAARSEEFQVWKRFVGREGRLTVAAGSDRPAARVKSADLADEHERPPIFIRTQP